MTEPRVAVRGGFGALALPGLGVALAALAVPVGARVATTPGPADGFGVTGFAALLPALAVCGFLPGWGLAGLLGVRDRLARTGLAVVLSAAITFAAAAAGLYLARDLRAASALLAVIAFAVAGQALVATPRARAVTPVAGTGRMWSAAGLAVAAWTLLVVVVYVANPELRYRVDGWFHGAVTERLFDTGLPAEDPYFAGWDLRYPWAWHVVLAATMQAGAAFGVTAFDAIAGWSALAALAAGAMLGAAGRAWARAAGLGARAADHAGAAAVALAVLGANPLGAAFWLARGLFGDDAGAVVLARPFARGASEVLLETSWNYPHVSIASFLDKFLTPTAFGLAEAAFLAFAGLALFAPPEGDARGARRFVAATLVAAFAFFLHAFAGAAIAACAIACALVPSRPADAMARGGRLAPLAAAALGALVTLPYWVTLYSGPGPDPGRSLLGTQPDMPRAILLVGGLLGGLAVFELVHVRRAAAVHARWVLAGGMLLALACVLTLMQRNETKFVNLGLLALAIPAGAALARAARPLVVATVLALVPTQAVVAAGFVADRGQDTPGLRRLTPALAEAYRWIGRNTHPRDIFLEAQAAGAHDPDRDLIVHGPRFILWGGEGYARNWGYPEADLVPRRKESLELATGTFGLDSMNDLDGRLEGYPWKLYAVRRGHPASALPLPGGGGGWTRVFANDALALDRFDRTLDGRVVGTPWTPPRGTP